MTKTPAKRSPDGFVAQRFPHDFNDHGHWLLTYWQEGVGLAVETFNDEQVVDWPALSDEPIDEATQ
jgi:hypothetical protein